MMLIDGKKIVLKKLRGRMRKDRKIILHPAQIEFLKKFGVLEVAGWRFTLEDEKGGVS